MDTKEKNKTLKGQITIEGEVYNETSLEMNKEQVKQKQQPSKSYTLKSFSENIKKIKVFKWLNLEDEKKLEEILQKAMLKYMKDEF